MSAAGGEKWQRAGRNTPSNTPNNANTSSQQQRPPQSTAQSSRTNTPSNAPRDATANKPNAWATNRRSVQSPMQTSTPRSGPVNTAPSAPGSSAQSQQLQQQQQQSSSASIRDGVATPPPPSSQRSRSTPALSANSKEIAEFLRSGYADAVASAGGDEKSLEYQAVTADGSAARSAGGRAGVMSNGQNFFAELARQTKTP